MGFGVVECVGNAPLELLARRKGLILEAIALKASEAEGGKNLTYSFFAIVDIDRLESVLLLCGPAEKEVAAAAFPDCVTSEDGRSVHLGKRVSRKQDFIRDGEYEPMI